jgi:hypothetical protein
MQEWWVSFLVPLHSMDWLRLKKVREWKCVEKYCCVIKTVVTNVTVVEELFDEFWCMKKCHEDKLKEWNENSGFTYGEKGSNVFCYFKGQGINVKNISYLVEFAFCVLGLNAAVEHTFP